MKVHVEFFGVPRLRTGCRNTEIELLESENRLGDLLQHLAILFPDLARDCIDRDHLRDGYMASLSGNCFVRDPQTVLPANTSVMILASDAGG